MVAMFDSESEQEKKKAAAKSSSSGAPVARLTGGGSGEIHIIERVVHESEGSSASMMLTKTNYMEWSLVMQVKLQAKGL